MSESSPRKFDTGKPQLNLIPSVALIEMGKVLAMGALKYDRGNWAKGLATSRYFDAAQRHLLAWNSGENVDPESGISHLAHAMVNLAFMLWNMVFRPDLDDRWHIAVPPVPAPAPVLPIPSRPEGTLMRYAWVHAQHFKASPVESNLRSPIFVSVDLCYAHSNNVYSAYEQACIDEGTYVIESVQVNQFGRLV